ncbi:MAG: hypothetical protein IT446_00200 [Phycisphaerales bacterium]|nr:hypothetical protein [Phycisphaerales bacterium]
MDGIKAAENWILPGDFEVKMTKHSILMAGALMVAGVVLVGCGQAEDAKTNSGTTSTAKQPAASGLVATQAMKDFKDDGKVLELSIEGNDLMQFNKDSFKAQPGQMVRLTLKHVGKLPAQNMGHNVVILNKGQDPFEFSADANEKGGNIANAYVPDAVRSRVIAYTSIVGGGQTTVVEFQAPNEAGDYPFMCSFPGHVGMMKGIFTVQ